MFMGDSLSRPAPLRSGRLQRIPSLPPSLAPFPSGNVSVHVMSALGRRTMHGQHMKRNTFCRSVTITGSEKVRKLCRRHMWKPHVPFGSDGGQPARQASSENSRGSGLPFFPTLSALILPKRSVHTDPWTGE